LKKVAEIPTSSSRIDLVNGLAVLRVKFTARPRNIFHKHADVMILCASLYCGKHVIVEDCQELIFRGGTGSAHSAENRKLNVLKKSSPAPVQTAYTMNPMYATQVMYPYSLPSATISAPQVQNVPQTINTTNNVVRAEALIVPELQDFDAENFFSDFINNKGTSLHNYEQDQRHQNGNVNGEFEYNSSSNGFSFNITALETQPNGLIQGTIEGTYQNKPFRGQFTSSLTDTNIQGNFHATFLSPL